MTIPYFPIEASSSLCICRSHHITPVEWEKEIRGILEPVEQTAAALLNLSANMLYLETGTTTSYSEVRAAPSCWGDICPIPLLGPPDSHETEDTSQESKKPWTKAYVPLISLMVLNYWITGFKWSINKNYPSWNIICPFVPVTVTTKKAEEIVMFACF